MNSPKMSFLIAASSLSSLVAGVGLGYVLSKSLKGTEKDPLLAEYSGKKIFSSQVLAGSKTKLYELEEEIYRTKEQALNEFLEGRLLEEESKRQNLPLEKIIETEIGTQVENVSNEEVESFINSRGYANSGLEKDRVKEYLQYQKKYLKREQFLSKLKQKANLKVYLVPPEAPEVNVSTEGFPAWGNSNAPVTLVEFSDFQCPFCARLNPKIDQLKKDYGPEKVRIVFIDFPLNRHPRALPSSIAAHCAHEQGKFWDYYNLLFQNQAKLEDSDFKTYATSLQLNLDKFWECYDQKRPIERIEKAKQEAARIGIQSAPSLVINGTLFQGDVPYERIKEKIDTLLQGK